MINKYNRRIMITIHESLDNWLEAVIKEIEEKEHKKVTKSNLITEALEYRINSLKNNKEEQK